MTQLPEKPPRNVTETEHGGTVRHPPNEVDLALKVMILNGGSAKKAAEQLKAEGMPVDRDQLQKWRDEKFPRRYAQMRTELGHDVSEEMAGRALERAMQADDATQRYIAKAVEKIDEVEANHLAKNAYALSNAMSTNVEKAQLLRDRPTEIKKLDIDDAVSRLERLNVALSVESESEVIEVEAVEA